MQINRWAHWRLQDINKWLKKNEWAKKYFNVLAPQALVFMLYSENKELGKYFASLLNMRTDAFSDSKKLVSSIDNIAKGNTEKGTGQLGSVIGGKTSLPLVPYRIARDVQNIIRGVEGKSQIKPDYDSKGFVEGYYQQGVVDYIASLINPERGKSSENLSTYDIRNKYKNDKVKLKEALINDTPEVKEVPKYVKGKVEKDEHGKGINQPLTPAQITGLQKAKVKAIEGVIKEYRVSWTNEEFQKKVEDAKKKATKYYLVGQKLRPSGTED